ncbi:MAG: histidine phosphatase family protein [Candidatus Diapherotrites archaeon]|nr:histidine phosphatase family protein [Candidatus Diapherotrites archaeon]
MKLFLCRHGQTDWNKNHKFQGTSDIPLNETGIQQAKEISELLKEESFTAIYSSKLIRSIKTAELIAFPHKLELISLPHLNELNFGIFEGKTMKEIAAQFGNAIYRRIYHKYDFIHPEGETYAGIDETRIKPFTSMLLSEHNSETICIVAHEGVNRLIISNLIGLNPRKQNIKQPNNCVYVLEGTELGKFKISYFCTSDEKKKGYMEYES